MVHGVKPRAVVAPATSEEAAAVLALASAEGWAVEPAGAGGWLDAGGPPTRVDLVVTTERMARLEAHEPADLVATAESGLALRALGERLARHRQWLPLDPPARAGATLGAVVSLAAAGPLREGYGTPRDHVLGLRLVTGDGRIVDLGGKVVKNVAGYDLIKPVIGGRGTLGLITRLHLRLRPVPGRDATLAVHAAAPAALLELVAGLREERIETAALELVSVHDGAGGAGARRWRLLARLQGNAEAVAATEDRVRRLAAGASLEASRHEGEGPDPWAELAGVEADAGLAVRMADAPSRLGDTLRLALELPGVGSGASIAAHAGAGVVRVSAVPPANVRSREPDGRKPDDRAVALARTLAAARAALVARGGGLTVTRAPATLLERIEPFGDPGPALRLMKELKNRFDPAGVLAPGRFVA